MEHYSLCSTLTIVSFPWTVLITGASTVTAGLVGAWTKNHYELAREKRERRIRAYSDFILSVDELIRILDAPGTLSPEVVNDTTLAKAVGQGVGSVQRAYAAIYLVGSKKVRSKAKQAWTAAWDLHAFFDPVAERSPEGDLGQAYRSLQQAGNELAREAQGEVSGRAMRRWLPHRRQIAATPAAQPKAAEE